MNYTLTNAERGYNISFKDGLLSMATGLSGAPYTLRHWDLSSTCQTQYRLGHRAIALLEAIPVIGALASLIERIVVYTYNQFSTSSLANTSPQSTTNNSNSLISTASVNPVNSLLPVDLPSYEALKARMKEKNFNVYITDETGKHSETSLRILGFGGCKKAVELTEGRALLLPNMDSKTVEFIADIWERVVEEEVAMSNNLRSIGLLSPLSKRINITLSEDSEKIIPAYICESFKNLATTQNLFIIDTKNAYSSTWNRFKYPLFNSEEARLNEHNWKLVTDSLLTDIAKICLYGIPANADSLNIAIVKKPCHSDENASHYEIRYFGFDFSDKDKPLSIPTMNKINDPSSHANKAKILLARMLDNIFFYEFGKQYTQELSSKEKPLMAFRDKLIESYTKEVLGRIQCALNSNN